MALNRARVSQNIGLSGDLSLIVTVEYFDSAASSIVLWTEVFRVPIGATTTQLQAVVTDRGQVIRSALAALAAAQTAVPSGTTVTVP